MVVLAGRHRIHDRLRIFRQIRRTIRRPVCRAEHCGTGERKLNQSMGCGCGGYAIVKMMHVFQLWDIMGDMSRPLMDTVKHFMARAVCLIALPISLYIFYFWIHLTVLYKR